MQAIEQDVESSDEDMKSGISCFRYTEWYPEKCFGEDIRVICNFATADMPKLSWQEANSCLFHNKYNLQVDPVAPVLQYYQVFMDSLQSLAIGPDRKIVYHESIMKMIRAATSILA